MRDLSDQKWASGVRDVAAHAHNEPTSKEHRIWVAGLWEGLDDGADDDKNTPNRCTHATTQDIGDVWCEEQDSEPSKTWEGSEKAQS